MRLHRLALAWPLLLALLVTSCAVTLDTRGQDAVEDTAAAIPTPTASSPPVPTEPTTPTPPPPLESPGAPATSLPLTPPSTDPNSTGRMLRTEKVAGGIEEQILEQTGQQMTVACPKDITVEAGNQFECTATDTDGNSSDITVTQEDNEGNVDWKLQESPRDTAQSGQTIDIAGLEQQIEDGIEQQTGISATLDCPNEVAIEAGGTFECTVQAEGVTATVVVTQKDSKGNVTWKVKTDQEDSPLSGLI